MTSDTPSSQQQYTVDPDPETPPKAAIKTGKPPPDPNKLSVFHHRGESSSKQLSASYSGGRRRGQRRDSLQDLGETAGDVWAELASPRYHEEAGILAVLLYRILGMLGGRTWLPAATNIPTLRPQSRLARRLPNWKSTIRMEAIDRSLQAQPNIHIANVELIKTNQTKPFKP